MKEAKTIQIIPADGWYAKFKLAKFKFDVGSTVYSKLICWELEENGAIHGIYADCHGLMERADETSNFVGYKYKPTESEAKP